MSPLATIRQLVLIAVPAFLCASGCTSLTTTSMMPVQVDDPVQLSPNLMPLNDPLADRSRGIAVYGYRPRITNKPIRRAPERIDRIERANGPQLAPVEPSPVRSVVLSIDAAKTAQIGNGVTFNIVARNPNDYPVTDVVVVADFDEALTFPGHPEKRVRRSIGTLAAGETRDFAVMLTSKATGRHCVRFTATVDEIDADSKEVCVEYVANDLEISVIGPKTRTVGSRAEFTIKLQNRAPRQLSDVQLAVTYDESLEPREGSTGARFEKQSLSWDLRTLQPGETVQVQVEFECLTAINNTCVVADVTSRELPDERKAQCLEVVELSGPLQVELRDTRDPIALGETTEHVVTIHNRSARMVTGIRLTALVPGEFSVASTTVRRDGREINVAANLDKGRLTFGRIAELPAGSTLEFRIGAKALKAGDANFTISVMYPGDDGSFVISEPISVSVD
ncbi:MAG: hypothetical protein HOL01_22800 [Planctomycetaceae bacterium]|jgi:hypothetical protein|nr:hypothetical protein [Planctomycetaceae bacterium]MBT6485377.1 hypothetical protein [Planctomycetaceae bacterium]MBT6497367.1 hypothetical protein [Planctomycetaceae bacterium]